MILSKCIRVGAAAAAVFITPCFAEQAEKLTNKDGKEIMAVVGRITDGKVNLAINGKAFSVALDSLSEASMKRVKEIDSGRIKKAGDRREYWAAREELKKKSADFRGLWLGMTKEEADMVEQSTYFAWRQRPKSKDDTREAGSLTWSDRVPDAEVVALAKFITLAENAQGDVPSS